MIGTLINCAAIIAGSLLGLLFRRGMKESISKTVMQGVGLSVILIGVMGAIKTGNTLLVILSMVIGGITGSLIDLDAKMNHVHLIRNVCYYLFVGIKLQGVVRVNKTDPFTRCLLHSLMIYVGKTEMFERA